jgi:peroxiredoxin
MRFVRKPVVLICAVLIGFILFGFSFLNNSYNVGQNSYEAPYKGAMAPQITSEKPEGAKVSLSDFSGKVVVLNFWASWCPPCRAEMKSFQRVYEKYRSKQVVVIGLNTTQQDDLASAVKFADEQGITFPVWLDLNGEITRTYQVRAMPTTFFIMPTGEIAEVMIGGPLDEAVISVAIEKMLLEMEE